MKKTNIVAITFGLAFSFVANAQHAHLNAGAISTAQDSKLIFDNGADFSSAGGYIKTLTYTNSGTYAGYYQQSITLTALAATPPFGGPVPNAPALGSYIQAGIISLDGPNDSQFAFWETGSTNPTIVIHPGDNITNLFHLTEADGSPGTDPYGHIHGRRFTATKPGIYKVTFVLRDTSTNGLSGGPIHKDSDPLSIYFQAGVTIQTIEISANQASLKFGATLGDTWQVEATTNIANSIWSPVGTAIAGDDYLHWVFDDQPIVKQRFFRVRSVTP
jgi:hypothetical protein